MKGGLFTLWLFTLWLFTPFHPMTCTGLCMYVGQYHFLNTFVGPSYWPTEFVDFCSSVVRQSPIDIIEEATAYDAGLQINKASIRVLKKKEQEWVLVNNGHECNLFDFI